MTDSGKEETEEERSWAAYLDSLPNASDLLDHLIPPQEILDELVPFQDVLKEWKEYKRTRGEGGLSSLQGDLETTERELHTHNSEIKRRG